MTFLPENEIEKNPLDQTFGSNALLSGIDRTENDLPFDRTVNPGYDSPNELTTEITADRPFAEPAISTGIKTLGNSDITYNYNNFPSDRDDRESPENAEADFLTKEPLNSSSKPAVKDTEPDLVTNPGLTTDNLADDGDNSTNKLTENNEVSDVSDRTKDSIKDSTSPDNSDSDNDETNESKQIANDESHPEVTEELEELEETAISKSDDSISPISDAEDNFSDITDKDSGEGGEHTEKYIEEDTDITTAEGSNVVKNSEITDAEIDFDIGNFKVDATGEVGIDFIFDGGGFGRGQIAIVSRSGMEHLDPNSVEFIKEAATRAASNSELGHIVIDDSSEGAKFTGKLGENNQNYGDYQGVKTFTMRPGDEFFLMLVPNGSVQQVLDNPNAGGSIRPLFSLATANPDDAYHVGQISDITGDGNAFAWEDLRVDKKTDKDYNDIILQIRGAKGTYRDC